ncbi:MAG: peptidoglycan-binding protein, partial [Mesorhizobium sp.]
CRPAIMMALAGLQLGKAFLSDPVETANNQPALSTQTVETASLNATVAPQADTQKTDTPKIDAAAQAESAPARPVRQAEPVQEPAPAASVSASPESAAAMPAEPASAEIGPVALRDAAAGGDAKALFEVGSRYAESRGVKEDMKAAAKWYEQSAELGFAPAEYRIGNFYEKGIGVARDIKKAKTYYQLA